MNTAIIVAAGTGTRFKSEIPKQFIAILGKPVLIHTLERFDACDLIDELVLVLASDAIDTFPAIAANRHFVKPIRLGTGGKTRAESVRNGLDAIDPNTEIIAVHDGARPLVSVSEISQVITKAAEVGAACLVAPITDTVKQVEGGNIVGTVDRNKLRRALTPQAFRAGILREAFEGIDLNEAISDECFLVDQTGREIAFIEGSPRNIKITNPDDIVLVKMYLEMEEQGSKCTA